MSSGRGVREEQLIAFALVRAIKMIMLKELSDSTAQRRFAKEDELRQTLALDRAYPAFRESIQIGTLRGQDESFNAGGMKRMLKGSAELAIAVMQNKTDREQGAVDVIHSSASHLHHPFLRRMLGDSSQSDATCLQLQKEQHMIRLPSRAK